MPKREWIPVLLRTRVISPNRSRGGRGPLLPLMKRMVIHGEREGRMNPGATILINELRRAEFPPGTRIDWARGGADAILEGDL